MKALATTRAGAAPAPSAPGEFSTGWPTLVLALAGVATSVSALLIYSLGTLIVPLQGAFGWSRADLQIAVSFLAAGGAISVNLVGWLNLRYGMRSVTAVSMFAVALAFAALSQMHGSIGWMYLGYFVLPFIGLGTTPVTWTHIVALHFHRHRGLALSLVLCGTGVSAAVLPSVLTWAMGRWGWQAGYLVLAALPLLMWLAMSWRHLPARGAEPTRARSAAAAQAAITGMPSHRPCGTAGSGSATSAWGWSSRPSTAWRRTPCRCCVTSACRRRRPAACSASSVWR